MRIVKCENGHFFDGDKYGNCPHCASAGSRITNETTVSLHTNRRMTTVESNPVPADSQNDSRQIEQEAPVSEALTTPAATPSPEEPAVSETPNADDVPDAPSSAGPELPAADPFASETPPVSAFSPPVSAGETGIPETDTEVSADESKTDEPPAEASAQPAAVPTTEVPVREQPEAEEAPTVEPPSQQVLEQAPLAEAASSPQEPETTPSSAVASAESHLPVVEPLGKYAAHQAMNRNPLPASDDSTTVGYYEARFPTDPVVGWLVEIVGPNAGISYDLKTGVNHIGREFGENDVVLYGDNSVSRRQHAAVIYEPKTKSFLLRPAASKVLFYLNDTVVIKAEALKSRDVIEIGKTKLLFVPLCGDDFVWDQYLGMEEYA